MIPAKRSKQPTDNDYGFAKPLRNFKSTLYVMTGAELMRGLGISFVLGLLLALFCFAVFH